MSILKGVSYKKQDNGEPLKKEKDGQNNYLIIWHSGHIGKDVLFKPLIGE